MAGSQVLRFDVVGDASSAARAFRQTADGAALAARGARQLSDALGIQSKTAQVPGEAVTATAIPVSAAWAMGDGKTVTCKGPGTAYAAGDNPSAASPTCGYTYEASSAGQPGGAYKVTVTITWDITWAGAGGAGGVLAPLQTVAAAQFRVAESQALNTNGG